MDTIRAKDPMQNPPQIPLGGLDPANLLKQGVAEDTFMDGAASPFNPPPIEELSAIFPQFEILEIIGQGGMGAVYKVRQKDLDRIVALKILPPAIGQSPEFSKRFTREAKALAKLNHPGIVTLHEFGQQDGLYFILMEFVDGVNLAQLMKSGRISPREALAIVPQICDALQFAHDQGIVHRDIKPENLLLDRLGRVKIADFGIAKIVDPHSSFVVPPSGGSYAEDRLKAELPTFTEAGKIIGTPQYMAPEQISHPSEVDHRADIYALGVVFYQMLTGELPGKRLEAPSKKVHIDVRLDEIVLRAMEKDPEMRYQQASVMKTRVETIVDRSSSPDFRPKRNSPIVKKLSTLSIFLIVLFCVFTLIPAFVGTVAFFWYRTTESKTGNHLSSQNGDVPVSRISGATNVSDRLDMQVDPPLLMTEFGEFKSEQSPWSIRVSAQDRTLHISRQPDAGGIGTRISPEKWRALDGWFAFIEDQTHAWTYDGDGKLMLMEVTPEKSTLYETETIIRRVPEAIISRISQATRGKIGIEADKNEGAKALLKAQGEAPVQIPLKKNHQQVFTSYSPDRVILASLTPWGFIADVPESFELTPQNAWAENLKKIPDVDIHDDVGSSGMSGMMLRKNNNGAQAHQGFIQDFARINFFSEFKDDSFHFRGEIKEGEDSRLTEVQGSLAIDERMVVKLGAVPKKRLRYLVFWVTCATHHVKKSPEQMEKDREHALEWLGLLDRGDYSKASATAMDDSLFRGLNEVEWSVALTEIRKPRGAVISRVFKTAFEPGGIVGAQSGEYRLMQFKTEFADGTKAVESITFYKDRDYTWKAVGYFIDPASGAKIPIAERLGGPEIGVLAGTWLAGIDAEKYSQSWKNSAQFFQKAITEAGWSDALTKVRKPLGEMKSRKLLDAKSAKSLPGAPNGEYFVIQFDTTFAAKEQAVETVTFMLEKDGTWNAAGYFIK